MQILWLLMAGLIYVLVTCVLTVAACQRKHAVDIHDRIRDSKRLRQQYLDAVRSRGGKY